MIGTILWAIIAGAILGIIGRLIVPGRQNIPWWATIGAGILAAWLGGVIADWLGVGDTDGIDWIRHLIQVLVAAGAVALIAGFWGKRQPMGRTRA